jgi:hypothetical protein
MDAEYEAIKANRHGYALPCETDPDLWFGGPESDRPARKPRAEVNAALTMAAGHCLVDCPDRPRLACLSLGLRPENVNEGVWGGLLPKERQRIARAREAS